MQRGFGSKVSGLQFHWWFLSFTDVFEDFGHIFKIRSRILFIFSSKSFIYDPAEYPAESKDCVFRTDIPDRK